MFFDVKDCCIKVEKLNCLAQYPSERLTSVCCILSKKLNLDHKWAEQRNKAANRNEITSLEITLVWSFLELSGTS